MLNVEVFQYTTEDEEKIATGFKNLFSTDSIDSLPTKLTYSSFQGFHKNEIILWHLSFNKKKDIKQFITQLLNRLLQTSDFSIFEDRLSENGELHLRLDKQALIGRSRVILSDIENSTTHGIFKITIKFEHHGKKTERPKLILNYLNQLIN